MSLNSTWIPIVNAELGEIPMNFKDMTVELLKHYLAHPCEKNVTISRELCAELFEVIKLLAWFYGPDATYKVLKELYEK